ncbi:FACT complex subunit POB3 [Astathelohania contejeani]|uniref:FACT complex subunit POB3 n=1 Tax=Astathelohania contejeani TaxID=164912 RepID=A0ABQ7I2K8_9MICR|nr:FACT complex subunit POB3 [Thelohania contejeani]
MEVISVEEAYHASAEGDIPVTLKIAEAGIAMKDQNGNVTTFKRQDLSEIEFFRSIRKYAMRISTASGTWNITGIDEDIMERIRHLCTQHYNLNVYIRELEIRNVLEGKLELSGDFLEYRNEKALIFDIPLSEIENVYEIRNELVIGLHGNTSELRFALKNRELAPLIKERIGGGAIKEVVTFSVLPSVYPRGKNEYIFCQGMLLVKGSTYEHKIMYSSIKGVFVLEKVADVSTFVALQLEPAIRQGQTKYNFIVLEFEHGIEEEFEISQEDVDEIGNGLECHYSGSILDSFLAILRCFSKAKTYTSEVFETPSKRKSMKCAFKAQEGFLYPLSKGLLFLPKAIYMPHNLITEVEFSRINLSVLAAKTFDLKVIGDGFEHPFSGLAKDEFGPFERYLSNYGIQMRSEVIEDEESEYEDEEEEEEEETFTEEESSEISEEEIY